MSSTSDIVGLLREASDAFYSGKQLTMDNDTYDGIVERLRELDPEHPYLSEAGHPPSDTAIKNVVCLTAQRDVSLEEKIIEKGMRCTTILSSSVTVIVVPDTPSKDKENATLRIARELGLKILTRTQFIQQYLS
jgi:NAD-dependent DNA ligase